MLDFPETASGVIVNGGSEANFTGLAWHVTLKQQ